MREQRCDSPVRLAMEHLLLTGRRALAPEASSARRPGNPLDDLDDEERVLLRKAIDELLDGRVEADTMAGS